ncbi:MAG: HAD-IA family hydrolase [Myxococcota bacterium]
MTIRGLCFDATGTLFETRESIGTVYSRAALAAGVKLPAWRLDDAFRRVLRHGPGLAAAGAAGATQAEREAAELAWWRDRVRQTFQATDSTVRFADPEALFRSLFDHYRHAEAWQVRPGVRPLLTRLRREGYRLGVASNFDHRLPEILEALELNDFFEARSIPSTNGLSKPDRGVFAGLAAALGLRLEELAYVGDDAPEVLEAIAGHGLRVFDVRTLPDLEALGDRLAAAPAPDARAEAAKLASSAAPPSPARPGAEEE